MNDLTVLIPTIGRDTLLDSIRSIDYPCNILVVADWIHYDHSNDHLLNIVEKVENVKVVLHVKDTGPASTKNHGLQYVNTKYLFILDDDDKLIPGFLEFAHDLLEEGNRSWVASHHKTGITELTTKEVINITPESFLDYYYDFDRYEDRESMIYPASSTFINFEDYTKYVRDGGYNFIGKFQDDVINMTDFMSRTNGYLHQGYYLDLGHDSNSVSRKKVTLDTFHQDFIIKLTALSMKNPTLWTRVLSNIIKNWYITNKE